MRYFDQEHCEQKALYPRGLLDNTLRPYPVPDYVADRERQFRFKPAIDALGGYRDTIQRT